MTQETIGKKLKRKHAWTATVVVAMAAMIVAQGGWLDVALIIGVGLAAWLVIELWYRSPRRA